MKMKKVLLALALAAPAIAAAGEADHWYVTPEIGAISPDYRRSLEDQNWLFGLALGREINRYFNIELNTEGARLHDRHDAGHLYTYNTTLDGLAILNRDSVVAPYFRLGVGVLRNTPSNGPNQTHFGADAGVGTYLNLWRSSDETVAFSLRPEVKVLWDEPGREQHLHDYIATLGFQFSFGGHPLVASTPPPPPPPPAAPPPAITRAAPPETAQVGGPSAGAGDQDTAERVGYIDGSYVRIRFCESDGLIPSGSRRGGDGPQAASAPQGGAAGLHRQHGLGGLQHAPVAPASRGCAAIPHRGWCRSFSAQGARLRPA